MDVRDLGERDVDGTPTFDGRSSPDMSDASEGEFEGPPAKPSHLALGNAFSCAVAPNDRVYCWGRNHRGQLGDGTRQSRSTPVKVDGLDDVRGIAAGGSTACAASSGGAVWCWGANDAGQLGDASLSAQSTPRRVPVNDVVDLSVADKHVCVVHAGGTVSCWGDDGRGQLGDGSSTSSTGPVRVRELDGVRAVEVGYGFSCARKRNGRVYCWGSNDAYQLGFGTPPEHTDEPTDPVVATSAAEGSSPEPLGRVLVISSGSIHACAVASTFDEGLVYCWGDDSMGALGDGTPGSPRVGARPTGGRDFSWIDAGTTQTWALKKGEVWCWGSWCISDYHLNGPEETIVFPAEVSIRQVVVSAPTVRDRCCYPAHVCAITDESEVYCAGNNNRGQLGYGGDDRRRDYGVEVANFPPSPQ